MSFVVETATEVEAYESRWNALIECMVEGLTLQEELRAALELHKREQPKAEEERATKPEERVAQIKAKVDALMARYGGTLQKITVWFATLQGHLRTCSASLDNVPLCGALNGVHEAVSRATRDRMPPKPGLKLEDPDSLEGRAKYLREVQGVVAQSEDYPRLVGSAIAALDETFKVFAREMDEARFKGQKSNTSAFRYAAPRHPLVGPPPAPQKAAQPTSDYAWLVS